MLEKAKEKWYCPSISSIVNIYSISYWKSSRDFRWILNRRTLRIFRWVLSLKQIFIDFDDACSIDTLYQPSPINKFRIMPLLFVLFVSLRLSILLAAKTMRHLWSIRRVLNRPQSIIKLFKPQSRDISNIQQIEYHLVEAHHWRFKIERLVDVAVVAKRVDELPLRQALVYPAVTDRLDLDMALCVWFQSLYHFDAAGGILKHVVTVPVLDVRSTLKDSPTIILQFCRQLGKLHLLFLRALNVELAITKDSA